MKNIILFFLFLFITASVFCQDSALIKKDIQDIGSRIFQLLQKMPKEDIKKINEETYLISFYVKDSVIRSLEVLSKPNSVLAGSVKLLFQEVINRYKLISFQEKHILFLLSINNSSRKPENRPKEKQIFVSDIGKLYASFKNYGLWGSISFHKSADKGMP